MSRRPSALLLASWLLVPGLSLAQEELDAEKVARIRRDEQAALKEVNEKHGNKKSSELSNEERRQVIEEQSEASAKVMDKHGVTAKEYQRHTARLGPEGNAEVAAATKRLEAEEQAKKDAEAKRQAEPKEISIQQGISEKNPVQLEGDTGTESAPLVEQGVAAEDEAEVAPEKKEEEDAPKRPSRGKRSKRRGGD